MQQYSIAQLGRAVGAAIIVVGFILAIWGAIDLGEFVDGDDKFRFFAQQALSWLAFGSLVYLAAEIFDRVSNKHTQ